MFDSNNLFFLKKLSFYKRLCKEDKKKRATNWNKFFASNISNKVLIFRIYKDLSKFNSKNTIELENRQETSSSVE